MDTLICNSLYIKWTLILYCDPLMVFYKINKLRKSGNWVFWFQVRALLFFSSAYEYCLHGCFVWLFSQVWTPQDRQCILSTLAQLLLDKDCTVLVGRQLRPILLDLLERNAEAIKAGGQVNHDLHERLCVSMSKLIESHPDVLPWVTVSFFTFLLEVVEPAISWEVRRSPSWEERKRGHTERKDKWNYFVKIITAESVYLAQFSDHGLGVSLGHQDRSGKMPKMCPLPSRIISSGKTYI